MARPTMKAAEAQARFRQIVATSPELIAALDALYPARAPDFNASEREVWAAAGERRLVERLLHIHDAATGDALTQGA